MRCKLTGVNFRFQTRKKSGVFPEAFSYSLNELFEIVKGIKKGRGYTEDNQVYTRLLLLYFLDERLGLPLGSVYFIGGEDFMFNSEVFRAEVRSCSTLMGLDSLKRCDGLILKTVPVINMIDHTIGVCHTFLYETPYTSFEGYLRGLFLLDDDIDDLLEYADTQDLACFYRLRSRLASLEGIAIGNDGMNGEKLNLLLLDIFDTKDNALDLLQFTGDSNVPITDAKNREDNPTPIEIKIIRNH